MRDLPELKNYYRPAEALRLTRRARSLRSWLGALQVIAVNLLVGIPVGVLLRSPLTLPFVFLFLLVVPVAVALDRRAQRLLQKAEELDRTHRLAHPRRRQNPGRTGKGR
jgi:hypothetical protein